MINPDLSRLLKKHRINALLFDLDGVLTQTAALHAQAWKRMFDYYLKKRGEADHQTYQPLQIETDYPEYIDGIPRYDGVRNFLKSRKIRLPEGEITDEPGTETVAGLGNQKNVYYQQMLQKGNIKVYQDTVNFIEEQKKAGLKTAIISASKNCKSVLKATQLAYLFDVRIDGVDAAKRKLPGKPMPDIFLEAARELNKVPEECAVFEDALAGVQAGKAGNFAVVVGVNHHQKIDENLLLQNGADLVISSFISEKSS